MGKRFDILKVLLALVAIAAVGFLTFTLFRESGKFEVVAGISEEKRQEIIIGGKTFRAEVARSEEELMRGLSGRDALRPNEGMLFAFVTPAVYSFWMKDMKFALDFVWIQGGNVIGITERVPPEPGKPDQELELYYPPDPVDMVLEVNAGAVAAAGIKVGDAVTLVED